jgi:hypothetical protein
VRAQTKQLFEDNIIEVSSSSHLKPPTVVLREDKSPRICLAARRVNKWTLPDTVIAPPISKLLQKFHGSIFITSLNVIGVFADCPEGRF